MKKKTLRTKIIATVLSLIMVMSIFIFPSSAAENATIPTTTSFRNETYYNGVYHISVCATYGRQSEANKRQESIVRLEATNSVDNINIAWYVTARNCYINTTDRVEQGGYHTVSAGEVWYQTGVAVNPYNMNNLSLFQRIHTYYDFGYDCTSVNIMSADVMHTVDEDIYDNFTIYGYPVD